MPKTYLFYDLETTGLNKSFDQILQFAAIRTDTKLNELQRYEYQIKLNEDVVPSPTALLTHKISIHKMLSGMKEIDAIIQIHQLMNEPQSISLGYNTLSFDDEFLRFSFYRNLLSPYTHQFANACGRMDIYKIAIMYYLFKPNVLSWPKINDKISLKLEHLCEENNLAEGRAHDAMNDVLKTLSLARIFFKEPLMWNYLHYYFDKRKEQVYLTKLDAKERVLLVDGKWGHALSYQCSALYLGVHTTFKNQLVWLRLDSADFSGLDEEALLHPSWFIRKKLGEPCFVLPPKERFFKHYAAERDTLLRHNTKWLKKNEKIFNKIKTYALNYIFPLCDAADFSSRLYLNDFWSDKDKEIAMQFHKAQEVHKIKWVKEFNPTLQPLAWRIIGRHYPHLLNEDNAFYYTHYLTRKKKERVLDYLGNPSLNEEDALKEIASLSKENSLGAEDKLLLQGLKEYLLLR